MILLEFFFSNWLWTWNSNMFELKPTRLNVNFPGATPEMWLYWGGKSEAANKKDQPINPRVCNLYWTGAFKFKRFFWGGKLKEDGHWTCWILDNCFFLERGSLNFLHHWGNLSDDPLLEFQRLVRCMVVGRETTHQFIPLGLPTLIVRCHVPGKVISVPMMQRFHCMNLHSKRCEIRDKKHRERLDTLFLYRAPVIHQGRRLCWSIPFSKLENHSPNSVVTLGVLTVGVKSRGG